MQARSDDWRLSRTEAWPRLRARSPCDRIRHKLRHCLHWKSSQAARWSPKTWNLAPRPCEIVPMCMPASDAEKVLLSAGNAFEQPLLGDSFLRPEPLVLPTSKTSLGADCRVKQINRVVLTKTGIKGQGASVYSCSKRFSTIQVPVQNSEQQN